MLRKPPRGCCAAALLCALSAAWSCGAGALPRSAGRGEDESAVFGLTHRTASDRSYFLLSYVAASGRAWRVDPGEPAENLPCRLTDLRVAIGRGEDLGPLGVIAQASLRAAWSDGGVAPAGAPHPSGSALRGALFWDVSRLGAGHLRLQAVHRRACSLGEDPSVEERGAGRGVWTGGTLAPGEWAASTMMEAAWGCLLSRGAFCARAVWDLGGPAWGPGRSLSAYGDLRHYFNPRVYLQLGAVVGLVPLNAGFQAAVGTAPTMGARTDVDGWVQSLGWEVALSYDPGEDEPYAGTLLRRDALVSLAIRVLR